MRWLPVRHAEPAGQRHRLAGRGVAGEELRVRQVARGNVENLEICAWPGVPMTSAGSRTKQASVGKDCSGLSPRVERRPKV